jgi:hypothetical protein
LQVVKFAVEPPVHRMHVLLLHSCDPFPHWQTHNDGLSVIPPLQFTTHLAPQQVVPGPQQVAPPVLGLGQTVNPVGQVCADVPDTLLSPKAPPTAVTNAAFTAVRRETGEANFLVSSSNF